MEFSEDRVNHCHQSFSVSVSNFFLLTKYKSDHDLMTAGTLQSTNINKKEKLNICPISQNALTNEQLPFNYLPFSLITIIELQFQDGNFLPRENIHPQIQIDISFTIDPVQHNIIASCVIHSQPAPLDPLCVIALKTFPMPTVPATSGRSSYTSYCSQLCRW